MSQGLFEDNVIASIIDNFDEDLNLVTATQVAILIAVAQCDGEFQQEEQELLSQTFRDHYQVTVGVLKKLFADVRILMDQKASQDKLNLYCDYLKKSLNMQEKIIFIHIVKDLIAADEKIDKEEDIIFKNILHGLGLNFDQFDLTTD